MALNASGPIALAGSTAGVSIALELSLGTTTAISLNQTNVRTLAGVPSGAIVMPTNFYGKSSGTTVGIYYGGVITSGLTNSNLATRINVCGALIGSQTTVGTARVQPAGATIGSNGVFYGGYITSPFTYFNTVTRINSSGALVGSETNVGTARYNIGGALIGTNGVYYGGFTSSPAVCRRLITRINACGAIVGSEVTVALACASVNRGAPVGSYGMYHNECLAGTNTKLNSCGSIVAKYTGVGTTRNSKGVSSVGSVMMIYGGCNYTCCLYCSCTTIYTYCNTATRVNVCGALVGSQTNVGTARASSTGSKVGSNALFYTGLNSTGYTNKATRINACGALVGSETTVGTTTISSGGASV